jgi:ACS family D-galactonate transporter-like MFS transporter
LQGEDGMAAELGYSNSQRGAIMSAFGWAYTATQIPGGYLSQTIGPKRTLGFAVALGAVAGILMPVGAHFSFVGPLALNAVIGLSQGPVFPVIKGVMAKWLLPDELARGNAAIVAAPWYGGQMVQFLLSPHLLRSRGWRVRVPMLLGGWQLTVPGGWRLAWYVYAPFGLLWCMLWWWTGADSPSTHPRIHPETLQHLGERWSTRPNTSASEEEAGLVKSKSKDKDDDGDFGLRVMWRVCRARPVFLTTLCLILDGAGLAHANWLPQFYSTQLGFDLGDTGIVVALPLLVGLGSSLLGGLCADIMLTRGGVPVTTVRRFFNVIPTVLMACCTLGMIAALVAREDEAVAAGSNSGSSDSTTQGLASRRDQILAVGLQMTAAGMDSIAFYPPHECRA